MLRGRSRSDWGSCRKPHRGCPSDEPGRRDQPLQQRSVKSVPGRGAAQPRDGTLRKDVRAERALGVQGAAGRLVGQRKRQDYKGPLTLRPGTATFEEKIAQVEEGRGSSLSSLLKTTVLTWRPSGASLEACTTYAVCAGCTVLSGGPGTNHLAQTDWFTEGLQRGAEPGSQETRGPVLIAAHDAGKLFSDLDFRCEWTVPEALSSSNAVGPYDSDRI